MAIEKLSPPHLEIVWPAQFGTIHRRLAHIDTMRSEAGNRPLSFLFWFTFSVLPFFLGLPNLPELYSVKVPGTMPDGGKVTIFSYSVL